MNSAGLILVTVIQLATFLAPLVLARAGFMGGEAAGLTAILGWFVLGMPLSYAVIDRPRRVKVQRESRLPAMTARSAFRFR